jgi:putative nucleotidyltransferase with HDIG domain
MADFEVRQDRRQNRIEFLTESGFWDQSFAVRMVIGAFFILIFFLVVHFRDVRLENLELDSVARAYTTAQVDFDFIDSEATSFSVQEAFNKIKVWPFKIDDKDLDQQRREFRRQFQDNNDLWHNSISEKRNLEEAYLAVDSLFEAARKALFTDSNTCHELRKNGINLDLIYPLDGIGEQGLKIPENIWKSLANVAYQGKEIPELAKDYALNYLEEKFWRLDIDPKANRMIREKIYSQIPPKRVYVNAGTKIIDKGEKVTAVHIEKFMALRKALKEKRQLHHILPIITSLTLVSILVLLSGLFLRRHYSEIFFSNRRLMLIFCIQSLVFAFSCLIEKIVLYTFIGSFDVIDSAIFIPLIVTLSISLFPIGIVIFLSFLSLALMAASLPIEGPSFYLVNLVAFLVAISTKPDNQLRRSVFLTSAKMFLATALTALCLNVYTAGNWDGAFLNDLYFLASMSGAIGIMTLILLPLIETGFKVVTEISLMDYLDPSRELLRRLSIEAPGTYQHSLMVAHLAEVAASSIGARSLFCRVTAFYHDIGKLAFPHYFVENQQGVNVHQLLTPLESAQVIIAHISEGVMMARKHGLPEPFIDIIKEHHGTSLVYYFWCRAKEALREGQTIQEKEFRYCGPKPRTKESVIIMLADCLEAGSRSIENLDEEKTTQLMESIVRTEIKDGQLDQSNLSLQELSIVKKVLVKTLVAASHSRIKYPKRESDGS